MPIVSNIDVPAYAVDVEAGSNIPDVLDRNWQTTTAAALAVATGGVTGAIMLSAFPAQTIATGTAIGGLALAGQRRHEGKDPLFGLADRFKKNASEKDAESTDDAVEPAVEPAAA